MPNMRPNERADLRPDMDNETHSDIGDFDWLKSWARLAPGSIAFKDADSGTTYSYRQLLFLSCKLADRLVNDFKVAKGERVAVWATNELETVALFFACLRAGATMVPVNFRLTGREVEHILEDSESQLLVLQNSFAKVFETVGAKARPKNLWMFESLQEFTATELAKAENLPPSEMAVMSHATPSWFRPQTASANDACMILYTSGTTGAPKGACITPKMLHWNSLNTTLRLNLSESDVFVSFLPFFHTGGWNVLLTPFVHRGARTVLTKKFEPDRILELCETEGATIMFGVPTTMEMMSRSSRFEKADLSKVRYAIVGGEPMSIDLIGTWQKKGVPIRQGFGLTEFGPNVFSLDEEDAIRKIGSIGFPNFYIETRVVDDHGNNVSPEEIGELLLRGPVCMPGYWKNEKASRDSIVDGWFHTGDLVRFDAEGYFYVAGRKKDMFISGGENVYPVEVERVLSQHPAVREVAVIGLPDEKWGESGCAVLALNEGAQATSSDILQFCADKLAKFKIPKRVEFMKSLPKGDSGKILKRDIKSQLASK